MTDGRTVPFIPFILISVYLRLTVVVYRFYLLIYMAVRNVVCYPCSGS